MTSPSPFDYATLTARNAGYVSGDVQRRIRETRLLIAGCGIGSSTAVCAARIGFQNFVLVDGDVVDAHNLNRQFYEQADVGRPKVEALRDALLRINPQARVEAIRANLDAGNTPAIVGRSDIVFDTVDFLDLPAILGLHHAARAHRVPVFTALSVGFGALVWYFPPDAALSLPDIVAPNVAAAAAAQGGAAPSYAGVFASFIERLAPHLDSEVVEQVARVLQLMKEGRPCPAPQVAVGSFAVAAMAVSMIHDMLAGRELPSSHRLVVQSYRSLRTTIVDLAPRAT
jgi:molybdopterin/thiamine biosynthesis adenylyltransferase